ncbi:hypothetical protein PRUPE_7G023600 [Prunus persica]|uniref:Uncharacterized protein n=1 Tax=Prunus persica TaxID=3760 RepID=A0A251N5J9_PRUPE|nr:hypothetical protein PRUPE_7G023600 [Prunus persica]
MAPFCCQNVINLVLCTISVRSSGNALDIFTDIKYISTNFQFLLSFSPIWRISLKCCRKKPSAPNVLAT